MKLEIQELMWRVCYLFVYPDGLAWVGSCVACLYVWSFNFRTEPLMLIFFFREKAVRRPGGLAMVLVFEMLLGYSSNH